LITRKPQKWQMAQSASQLTQAPLEIASQIARSENAPDGLPQDPGAGEGSDSARKYADQSLMQQLEYFKVRPSGLTLDLPLLSQ
jgi:hypothetical protein